MNVFTREEFYPSLFASLPTNRFYIIALTIAMSFSLLFCIASLRCIKLIKNFFLNFSGFNTSAPAPNGKTHLFIFRKDTKFKTSIDLRLRIRYYLISYLRRMELEKKTPTFDEIILNILPLLKNGVTPEDQTILSVLEDIGLRVGKDSWRLKPQSAQATLFNNLFV